MAEINEVALRLILPIKVEINEVALRVILPTKVEISEVALRLVLPTMTINENTRQRQKSKFRQWYILKIKQGQRWGTTHNFSWQDDERVYKTKAEINAVALLVILLTK